MSIVRNNNIGGCEFYNGGFLDGHKYSISDRCNVVKNEYVNSDYIHIVLSDVAYKTPPKPGQFFHILCPPVGDYPTFLRRPMSIYRFDYDEKRLEFLYKVAGKGTRALSTLGRGDKVNVLGPLGRGFSLDLNCRHLVLLVNRPGFAGGRLV